MFDLGLPDRSVRQFDREGVPEHVARVPAGLDALQAGVVVLVITRSTLLPSSGAWSNIRGQQKVSKIPETSMATTGLIRGMGSFFKECEHPESRWSKCPHNYKIRYRNASGQQTEESGFADQESAKTRLAQVYHARKVSPVGQRKAERIKQYGSMHFLGETAEA
ncbi:hypothetical protein AMK19_10095 [Kitasatospora sp. CB01950]|nr:hypothetical protein AMK19_10095 [Kitasatospora sp. CB01950]